MADVAPQHEQHSSALPEHAAGQDDSFSARPVPPITSPLLAAYCLLEARALADQRCGKLCSSVPKCMGLPSCGLFPQPVRHMHIQCSSQVSLAPIDANPGIDASIGPSGAGEGSASATPAMDIPGLHKRTSPTPPDASPSGDLMGHVRSTPPKESLLGDSDSPAKATGESCVHAALLGDDPITESALPVPAPSADYPGGRGSWPQLHMDMWKWRSNWHSWLHQC